MESVLTVRLDATVKAEGSATMRRLGVSPSEAVRELFDFTIKNDALPFPSDDTPTEEEIARRIRAFDACHTRAPLTLTDEELREERLRSRYGFDA